MSGKGDKDTRVKNRKAFNQNFDKIKFSNTDTGFVKVKGKITKKY
jgi:hypothetical protein